MHRTARAALVAAFLLAGCGSGAAEQQATVPVGPVGDGPETLSIEVLGTYPHDETAWTEGFELHDGQLLESTGREGQSRLRLTDPATGAVTDEVRVADELYAEGVTVVDGQAIQLTWKNETVLVTPLADLDPAAVEERTEAYDGEGWGLCYDGTDLVMSNGTSELQFRDPATFELRRSVPVTLAGQPVANINELECVDGQVWANVWLTTTIVVIDPTTGVVTATADVADLVPDAYRGDRNAVANGIAHDPETGAFWLTGKLWPVTYEVRFHTL
ncbi:MAG: glutaminyl-peptide cyclotransferase [Acidimicrobiales bacterium]